MINSKRLGNYFETLVRTDSVSKEENRIARMLTRMLEERGAEVRFDRAGEMTGGDCGNLVAKFRGNVEREPIFLSGHMDTVEPGRHVEPVFDNGVYRSDGSTILGADDKSAIAIILEVLDVIFENNLDHPPIEVIFTVCEEIGLLGAKYFDFSLMDAKLGYVLDSTDPEGIVINAPAAVKFDIKVVGKTAHAGGEPERGINAIMVASNAISRLDSGRIDHETTCNFGRIKGGTATNIVPDLVEIKGEVRSHDTDKLERVTEKIRRGFSDAADEYRRDDELPRVEFVAENDYPKTSIPEEHPVVMLADKASRNLGRELKRKVIGGGADANIFCSKGIVTGVLGTGMRDVHTVNENVSLADMESTARLVLEIIRLHAGGG